MKMPFCALYGTKFCCSPTLPAKKCKTANFRLMTFLVILDSLFAGLGCRKQVYEVFHNQFGLLFELQTLPTKYIRVFASKIQQTYNTDLEESFPNDIINFSGHLFNLKKDLLSPQKILECIRKSDIAEVFPDVETVLKISLTLLAINTETKR